MIRTLCMGLMMGWVGLSATAAEQVVVGIRGDLPAVVVETADGPVVVQRNQDTEHRLEGGFARTSRPCPPFCVQPMQVAEGVTTIGELELLDLISGKKADLIDARTEDWHLKETIPGARNIPYTLIAGRLDELGCTRQGSAWDCAEARPVALFCNGPWCGQSPIAIRAMLREGYPAARIYYYRGGMQLWKVLGFNTVEGTF